MPADGPRWRGHTHKELYLLLHDGPGAAASAEPSRRWEGIATSLGEIGEDLQKALEQSGASWSGTAAGAAYDRLSVTAAWASDTSAEAASMRSLVESQAEHIARARADMPVPEDVPAAQPDPTLAPAVQVVNAQTDLEGAEATASSAEERAFEVMAAYELNTNTTTGGLSTFDQPRDLSHDDNVHEGEQVGTQHTHASSAGLGPGGHGGGHGPHGGGPSGTPRDPGFGRPSTPSQGVFSGVLDTLFGGGSSGRSGNSRSSSRGGGFQLGSGGSSGSGGGLGYAGGSGGTSGGLGGPGGSGGPGGAGGAGGGASGPSAGPSSVAGGSASGAAVPKPGLGAMPPTDLGAAAAGHAAAVHSAGAAPVAPAAGVGGGGGADRMAMRRFGMDAIGSNQWFAETDEAVVGERPRRRRDFKENEQVIESVDILGQEHKLPPTVIGDGPTDR